MVGATKSRSRRLPTLIDPPGLSQRPPDSCPHQVGDRQCHFRDPDTAPGRIGHTHDRGRQPGRRRRGSSVHRQPRLLRAGQQAPRHRGPDAVGRRGCRSNRQRATTCLSLRSTSVFVLLPGSEEGLCRKKARKSSRAAGRGPSFLPGEGTGKSKEGCSGFRGWGEVGVSRCYPGRGFGVTVRGDPPGRGLTSGLSPGQPDAAAVRVEPSGRPAQRVRVEVWGPVKEQGRAGGGCQ